LHLYFLCPDLHFAFAAAFPDWSIYIYTCVEVQLPPSVFLQIGCSIKQKQQQHAQMLGLGGRPWDHVELDRTKGRSVSE
jgi:hypothetical protein